MAARGSFGDDSFPGAAMTFFAGTFVRHPLALAAARAVLLHLRDQGPTLQQGLAGRTAEMISGAARALAGTPFQPVAFSSNWLIHTARDFQFSGLLYALMRHRGFHIWENRPCFLSTAHTDAEAREVVTALEESVAELEDAGFFTPTATPARDGSSTIPTSEGQRELWCLCQQSPTASVAANECWTLRLDGPLDVDAFRAALRAVVARHESLRSSFAPSGETLRVAPAAELEIPLAGRRPRGRAKSGKRPRLRSRESAAAYAAPGAARARTARAGLQRAPSRLRRLVVRCLPPRIGRALLRARGGAARACHRHGVSALGSHHARVARIRRRCRVLAGAFPHHSAAARSARRPAAPAASQLSRRERDRPVPRRIPATPAAAWRAAGRDAFQRAARRLPKPAREAQRRSTISSSASPRPARTSPGSITSSAIA